MKKAISYIITALFLLGCLTGGAFASGEPSYTLSDKTVKVDEIFTIDVGISDNPGVISLRFKVIYDSSVLELQSVTDTGLLKGYTTPSPTVASPYTLRWADSLATSNNNASGTVVKLTFKALKETATTVSVEHGEARTNVGKKITFSDSSAEIVITPNAIVGDVNSDGDVNMKDVLLLRKIIAGAENAGAETEARADVDGDGNVNMKDVLKLRKIIAGVENQ